MLQLDNIKTGASGRGYVTTSGTTNSTNTNSISDHDTFNNNNKNNHPHHNSNHHHPQQPQQLTASAAGAGSSAHHHLQHHQHPSLIPAANPFFPGGPAGLLPACSLAQAHHGLGSTMHWGTSVFNPILSHVMPTTTQALGGGPVTTTTATTHTGGGAGISGGGGDGGSVKNDNPSDEDDDDDDYRPFTPPPPRERLSYTRYQLGLLNGIYGEVRYPNSTQKQLIAKRVGITREQVKIWFQNRRRKDVVTKTGSSKADGEDGEATSCDVKAEEDSSQSEVDPTGSTSANVNGMECDDDSNDSNDKSDRTSQAETLPFPKARSNSESTSSSNAPDDGDKNANDTSSSTGSNSTGLSKLVSPLVLKSMIAELNKFDNEYLKQKKNKKKNKSKSAKHAAAVAAAAKSSNSAPCKSSRLFQNYDMIAPPNKVTPTAFLNTSANRFKHAGGTSAFQNPRDNKLTPVPSIHQNDNRLWESFAIGSNPTLPSHLEAAEMLQQQRATLEQSLITNSLTAPLGLQNQTHPSSLGGFLSGATAAAMHHLNTQNSPLYDNLPVLSELLGSYKHQPNGPMAAAAAAAATAQRHFEQTLLSSSQSGAQQQSSEPLYLSNVSPGGVGQASGNACANGKTNPIMDHLPFPQSPAHHSLSRHPSASFGLNHRVFPFPLIAEPPVMLSNLRQTDPIKPQPQWPQSTSTLPHLSAGHLSQGSPSAEESFYRPLAISSLSNPYFPSSNPTAYSFPSSLQPPPHLWPSNSPGTDPSDFAQL